MATLIAVHTSEGCVGRCDARCYDAEGGGCVCICGGRNHGVGLGRALDNVAGMTREELGAELSRWLDEVGVPEAARAGARADVPADVRQADLFGAPVVVAPPRARRRDAAGRDAAGRGAPRRPRGEIA